MIASIQKICNIFILFVSLSTFAQTTAEAFKVNISGNGEQPLVFIPGLASSGKVFAETRAEFKDNFTCYTFTLAGFAGVPPMENPSFEKYKNAIAHYLNKNKIENPVIVGHSYGGALTMGLAADYPELPKKIVVVDALPHFAALLNLKKEMNCTNSLAESLAKSDEEYAKEQQKNIQFSVSDSTKHKLVLGWSLSSDRETVARVFCGYTKVDLREKLKNISVPSLVLLEPYFKNFEFIEPQFDNLKAVQIKYAPQGRHFLMYGAKDWYLEHLRNFIDKE